MSTDPSPCSPERAAQLKAEAIARLRASRPAWRNEHSDRLHREREARRISREYRQAQREAEQPTKVCAGCKRTLPLSAYSTKGAGKFNSRCRPCHSEKVSAHKRAKRAALTPEQLEEKRAAERAEAYRRRAAALALRLAEREADAAATEAEREAKAALKEAGQAAARAEALRRRLRKREAKAAAKAAARQARALAREQAKAEAHAQEVAAMRAAPEQFVGSWWDWTFGRLSELWLEAGPRECVVCKATVPPTDMHPPADANFRPGHCHTCAEAAYRAGWGAPPAPCLILLTDGTTITIAELARRHAARERGRRIKRFDRHWR